MNQSECDKNVGSRGERKPPASAVEGFKTMIDNTMLRKWFPLQCIRNSRWDSLDTDGRCALIIAEQHIFTNATDQELEKAVDFIEESLNRITKEEEMLQQKIRWNRPMVRFCYDEYEREYKQLYHLLLKNWDMWSATFALKIAIQDSVIPCCTKVNIPIKKIYNVHSILKFLIHVWGSSW